MMHHGTYIPLRCAVPFTAALGDRQLSSLTEAMRDLPDAQERNVMMQCGGKYNHLLAYGIKEEKPFEKHNELGRPRSGFAVCRPILR